MISEKEIVFLFDVDNTLLDNDSVQNDLRDHIVSEFGAQSGDRYFAIFEELRAELGYADYLGHCSATGLRRNAIHDCC